MRAQQLILNIKKFLHCKKVKEDSLIHTFEIAQPDKKNSIYFCNIKSAEVQRGYGESTSILDANIIAFQINSTLSSNSLNYEVMSSAEAKT